MKDFDEAFPRIIIIFVCIDKSDLSLSGISYKFDRSSGSVGPWHVVVVMVSLPCVLRLSQMSVKYSSSPWGSSCYIQLTFYPV